MRNLICPWVVELFSMRWVSEGVFFYSAHTSLLSRRIFITCYRIKRWILYCIYQEGILFLILKKSNYSGSVSERLNYLNNYLMEDVHDLHRMTLHDSSNRLTLTLAPIWSWYLRFLVRWLNNYWRATALPDGKCRTRALQLMCFGGNYHTWVITRLTGVFTTAQLVHKVRWRECSSFQTSS